MDEASTLQLERLRSIFMYYADDSDVEEIEEVQDRDDQILEGAAELMAPHIRGGHVPLAAFYDDDFVDQADIAKASPEAGPHPISMEAVVIPTEVVESDDARDDEDGHDYPSSF
jgi:hypothetical protein